MSPKEIRDTINAYTKRKINEIYTLSSYIKAAICSSFNDKCKFPENPVKEVKTGDWRASKSYLKALSKIHKGGAK